ncbi:MAG TPA: two-component regulator propeller domain-containing protein, partial [Daejeonella sp.]|nr:two-component regulator propeller domain-containing protein [Daejeonella sp.]
MGAYCISPWKTQFYNSSNGFTDNAVNSIFRDAEDNIWFATEGAGIYKYDGDKTMVFDKAQGLSNEVVMGFATDRQGSMWMNCFGNTLVKLHNGKVSNVDLPVPDSIHYSISHLFNDKDGNIWIGTSGAGLWRYDGKGFKNFPYEPGKVPKVIRYIMQDRHGTIWLATPTGCYLLSNGKFSHLKDLDAFVGGLLEIGNDSILVSTQKGNFLITGSERRVQLIPRKELQKTDLYCMAAYKNQVFFGTAEDGIWVWDLENNKYRNLTRREGLYSNTIYSVIADNKGSIWTGTGRGINKIEYNARVDSFTVSGAEYSQRIIVECNQNAVFLKQNKLWVGTTKGAVIFDLNENLVKKERPYIVLQSIKLFNSSVSNKNDVFSTADGFSLPKELKLAYRKNHINLNFKGIYLTNPSDVLYQYRLVGLDDTFSNPTTNSNVNYQTLPPGNYVFEARALNSEGISSDNMLRFPFSIRPAFYQTIFFRLAVILFLVLSGIALQAYLHKRKNLRLQQIEGMKREERLKARQQTAEDFHDDLGNKLTRISILTDILNMKLNGEHQEEKQLILQIKENASSLYRGTKDILWALDPKSDNLYEILSHISEFGMELFQDTAIEFSYEGITEQLANTRLPMEYSRNISMIFKEALNNSLRHAEAHHVLLNVSDNDKS